MTIKVMNEQQVVQEALQVLMDHLSPTKVARFWAAWQMGGGDYLTIREQLFGQETVSTLFAAVQNYQEKSD